MALKGYNDWVKAGEPYEVVASVASLQDTLEAHGYTVYAYPDEAHQTAVPPEDHTAYSSTGWPGKAQFGKGYAIDIMPPKPGQKSKIDGLLLPNLVQLGDQMVADRKASVSELSWLKYLNRTDAAGRCWHEKWQPDYVRTTSNDKGHIHASGRTDITAATGYDPVARIRGADDMTPEQDNKLDTVERILTTGWTGRAAFGVKYGVDAKPEPDMPNPFVGLKAQLTQLTTLVSTGNVAIKALSDALTAGGGSVDSAVILARVDEMGTTLGAQIARLEAELADAEADRDSLRAALAAALAPAAG